MTPTQKAYALLWRSGSSDRLVHAARAALLASLSVEEQAAAIRWVLTEHGEMTTSELIVADMRAGIFPRKSI